MQKFQPRIRITEIFPGNQSEEQMSPPGEDLVFAFPQTSFMAVTAYQNQEVGSNLQPWVKKLLQTSLETKMMWNAPQNKSVYYLLTRRNRDKKRNRKFVTEALTVQRKFEVALDSLSAEYLEGKKLRNQTTDSIYLSVLLFS